MAPKRNPNRILPPGICLVIVGIEGELIETEHLHYEKWFRVAKSTGVVKDEESFRKIWQEELTGVGDKKIHEILQAKPRMRVTFPSWKECQLRNDAYYRKNLNRAEIPHDMAEALIMLQMKGVQIMIVTHAPKELVDIQLDFIEKKTGYTFDREKIVVLDERKDKEAYVVAFDRANDMRVKDEKPALERQNVLVLDNNEDYLARAKKLCMNVAKVANALPEHLKQKGEDQKIPSLGWMNIYRTIADGLSPEAAPRRNAPRHTL